MVNDDDNNNNLINAFYSRNNSVGHKQPTWIQVHFRVLSFSLNNNGGDIS